LDLSVVVKDAAKGIWAWVQEVFPGAEQRDDSFHALYDVHSAPLRQRRRDFFCHPIRRAGAA
jgi:hypothetical protein